MELEVKHLTPYLPYALKVQYIVRDKVEKTGIMKSIIHNEDETHPTKVSIEWGDAEHIWMFKPILRPLSDLTKEIEINGEKFIPFIELANLFIIGINPKIINSTNGGCVISHKENGEEYLMLSQHIDEGCFKLKLLSTSNIVNVNNLSIFQKLCEWNFDIFDLISKGLAVNINTLSVE